MFLIPKQPSAKTPSIISQKKAKIERRADTKKAAKTKKFIPPVAKIPPKIIGAKKEIPKKIKGKIAIVIDDWGYNTNNLEILKDIKLPVTVAILPFLAYSREVAGFANENNYEVIIHMPMEPDDKEKKYLETQTLMVDMDTQTIKDILNEALQEVPYARGINNHMGSLATKDKEFMAIVFRELKKNNLYFLDSYVVSESVCRDISRILGVKFAKRSIFLDNEPDPEYIRGQLMELAREADKFGEVVGIGHDRENTLEVLRKVMPQLAEEGYQFVFVSDIVK